MIKEIINNSPSNMLRIEYMLGNTCNYKCSYCFPGSNEGTYKWPNIELVIKNLSHLLDHYKQNGKDFFKFYLIGGEPTLWKDLPKLVTYLKKNYNSTIYISTNATPSVNWWKNNAKYYDNIEISVHHEFADPDHIIRVADSIYEQQINVVANVLMDPDHFKKCQDLLEKLKSSKRRWAIIAKAVHFNGQTKYTEEQKNYFDSTLKRYPNPIYYLKTIDFKHQKNKIWVIHEDNSKQKIKSDNWFSLNQLNYFKDWTCNLGVDNIEVYQDGTISGNCREKIYNLKDHFNLYKENFVNTYQPDIEPVICTKEICTCTSEIVIRKKKDA
jgi:organic radical activating enzyme